MKYENLEYLNRPYGRTRAGDYIRSVARFWLDKATESAQPKLTGPIEIVDQAPLPPTGLVRIIPDPELVAEQPAAQAASAPQSPEVSERPKLYLVS